MKKMISFRNCLIAILCVTIIFLSIGFVVLSIKLKDVSDESSIYDVSFVDVEKKSSVKGSSIEPTSNATIDSSKKEIVFNFDLNADNDEVVYVANIRNNGTVSAKIVDILGSPDYTSEPYKSSISPVTITGSDLKDKIVEPGKEVELRLTVSYNSKTNSNAKRKFEYRVGLITQFVE